MLQPCGWAASSLSLLLPVTSAVCTPPLNPLHGPHLGGQCVCMCLCPGGDAQRKQPHQGGVDRGFPRILGALIPKGNPTGDVRLAYEAFLLSWFLSTSWAPGQSLPLSWPQFPSCTRRG